MYATVGTTGIIRFEICIQRVTELNYSCDVTYDVVVMAILAQCGRALIKCQCDTGRKTLSCKLVTPDFDQSNLRGSCANIALV